MDTKLFFQAITKFIIGFIIVGLLIFILAGTLHFPNGWLFMELLFIPMFIAGILLLLKNPELRGLYDENDDNTAVLYFEQGKAIISSFTEQPKIIEF